MKHRIDPTVDCVFKAILGAEENKNLLIHFLNAVIELEKGSQIKDVTILNPYNEREFIGDKLTVVDVKAIDEKGNYYQIEIQLAVHSDLKARILYTWSSIYHSQIQEGDNFEELKPVISIWLLNGNLFPEIDEYHIPFHIYNEEQSLTLTNHFAVHIIQLLKWKQGRHVINEKDRWTCFFREGKYIDPDDPPEMLNTKEMRQAMKVMKRISETRKDYLMYQSRLEASLLQNTLQKDIERAQKDIERAQKDKKKALKEMEKERAAKEKALKEKEKAQARAESLAAKLRELGISEDDI